MDHTHIVQAGDLDRFAPTRESQSVIPELIYWLVKQSCSNLVLCRIPYGDAVNQPGWDGMVETDEGFLEFVPRGKSFWEIGTNANPRAKATDDFKKRTDEIDDVERASSSFVFVTPRSSGSGGWSEPEQTQWLERRKDTGWKLIRIIDGVKLADWLREYPAIGKWMAKKLNLTANLGGIVTAIEHWENINSECEDGEALPPKLFTVGRNNACEALRALFEGRTQLLMLFAESPNDVADFISAFIAELEPEASAAYSNRCLYISDEQAWLSIVETRSPHVLVADPRLGLETDEGATLQALARRKGHAVVVPLCGAWSGDNPEILKLRSPSQSQIESVLKESGYTDIRATELARIGGERLSALRRHLRGYGSLPPYATWEAATQLAQAGLVGKWDGSNPSDRALLEMLLGKDYGEWIETLRPGTLRSDSPLVQNDEKWRFVARGEAWGALGSRVTDDDLERFKKTALFVLGEKDPKFELPKEERFAASVHGKVLRHSSLVRKGIAETLALIGCRPKALTSCSFVKATSTAAIVVRELLNKADWERWASLDSLMPLLAEAAPDEFLDAVESVLIDLQDTPFHKIFSEEGSGAVGGENYMVGLLWALETLAWSPEYLSRVSVILADIASFDTGGQWSNRPSNSLADIFLPWHVQTTATFDKRKTAIESVIREHPVVGWKLILALLPHNHGFTSGCHRPVWREFIPRDWKDSVSKSLYWEQIDTFTVLAVNLAKSDSEKLCELIKRLSDLPEPAHDSLLEHLNSDLIVSLPEVERLPIWECLDELVRHHRKFDDADWALPENTVNKIAHTAQVIAPTLSDLKYRHLFSGRDFDLYDEKGNFDEQRNRLDALRERAIIEIINDDDIDAVYRFASNVTAPNEVGRILGTVASDNFELSILPSFLDRNDDISARLVAGYVWSRFWKFQIEWVDEILQRAWTIEQKAKFLTHLPFEENIWERVSSFLDGQESLYWKNVVVNPYGPARDLTVAVGNLLKYGRGGAAVTCVSRMADRSPLFNESLALHALLEVIEKGNGISELNAHQTVELITHLQKSKTADQDALFKIEWNFLPWLDRFSSGSPATLEKRLASEPGFFAEVIGLVYRSKKSSQENNEQFDEHKKSLAKNAYKLLTEWKRCPGTQDDGSFITESFNTWFSEVRKLTEESGHAEVALIQVGHVLTYAPSDPDGLWIHKAVATVLNYRDTGDMRSGFTTQLFNNRGVYGFTHGQDERNLARGYRDKAEALDANGYTRFATEMREFAERYELQAEQDEKRNPYEY
ncbi:hypothetical protein VCSRO42_3365 [Vibrio cholerae]|uniref:hypothetical protein n=1 Tax=Vibrio harveyi group TaxID=717610 RepID=UPI000314613E|nr:hypothetical protein [Vibrio parahaemolyticus]GIB10441.1 hypothetical protein VCSRO42_3365 [Vibrio cholerae]